MGHGAATIAEIIPELRDKLTDLETPQALDPDQARFHLCDSITSFLRNASRNQPLMLVLDDVHWADRSSLLLLQFLARELAPAQSGTWWWLAATGMRSCRGSTLFQKPWLNFPGRPDVGSSAFSYEAWIRKPQRNS